MNKRSSMDVGSGTYPAAYCEDCGYPFVGLQDAERCPECGSVRLKSEAPHISTCCDRRHFRAISRIVVAIVITAAVWPGLRVGWSFLWPKIHISWGNLECKFGALYCIVLFAYYIVIVRTLMWIDHYRRRCDALNESIRFLVLPLSSLLILGIDTYAMANYALRPEAHAFKANVELLWAGEVLLSALCTKIVGDKMVVAMMFIGTAKTRQRLRTARSVMLHAIWFLPLSYVGLYNACFPFVIVMLGYVVYMLVIAARVMKDLSKSRQIIHMI